MSSGLQSYLLYPHINCYIRNINLTPASGKHLCACYGLRAHIRIECLRKILSTSELQFDRLPNLFFAMPTCLMMRQESPWIHSLWILICKADINYIIRASYWALLLEQGNSRSMIEDCQCDQENITWFLAHLFDVSKILSRQGAFYSPWLCILLARQVLA